MKLILRKTGRIISNAFGSLLFFFKQNLAGPLESSSALRSNPGAGLCQRPTALGQRRKPDYTWSDKRSGVEVPLNVTHNMEEVLVPCSNWRSIQVTIGPRSSREFLILQRLPPLSAANPPDCSIKYLKRGTTIYVGIGRMHTILSDAKTWYA